MEFTGQARGVLTFLSMCVKLAAVHLRKGKAHGPEHRSCRPDHPSAGYFRNFDGYHHPRTWRGNVSSAAGDNNAII